MYKKILVPVDGSHTSTLGLQEAIRLARDSEAVLRLIHVVDEFVAIQNDAYMPGAGALLEGMVDSGRQVLKSATDLAAESGVAAEGALLRTLGGRVAEIIVKEAREWGAEVIVMGTHGRRGVSLLVLGSDAEAVIKMTPVPLLLVRGSDSPKSQRAAKAR
jgi:nucleotide-binding universal stress UspA family protein